MKHVTPYRIFESTVNLTPEQVRFLDLATHSTPEQKNWNLNSRGLVDVPGSFYCIERPLTQNLKGIRFGEVSGQFIFTYNGLNTLEGSPHTVGRVFNCEGNRLTSLKGGPQRVDGFYICSKNPLESLEGAPLRVGADFVCSYFRVSDGEWGTPAGFIKVLKGHPDCEINPRDLEKARKLVLPFIDKDTIDDYFIANPLDLDLLDVSPEIKAGVLKRTGLEDISDLARAMRRGLI